MSVADRMASRYNAIVNKHGTDFLVYEASGVFDADYSDETVTYYLEPTEERGFMQALTPKERQYLPEGQRDDEVMNISFKSTADIDIGYKVSPVDVDVDYKVEQILDSRLLGNAVIYKKVRVKKI